MTGRRGRLADPGPFGAWSDEARRLSDTYTLHAMIPGNAGKFFAARLSDGGSDDVLYDHWCDAVGHQLHHTQCVYVCIMATGDVMTPEEAATVLTFWRNMYDAGHRPTHPDGVVCNGRCRLL